MSFSKCLGGRVRESKKARGALSKQERESERERERERKRERKRGEIEIN